MVKIRFICFFFLLMPALWTFSQSIVRSAITITGNSSLNNEGLLTYSVGEAISGTLISPLNNLTQGFQQPSLLNLGIDKINVGINAVEVYPNPVIDDLTILFNIRTTKLLRMDLYSSRGTLFRQDQISVSESGWIDLQMGSFPCGLYLLHVYSTDKQIDRLFKIEKM